MGKNIVVCFDGTSNEYGKNNTNVVKTFEALEIDDSQVAFYDPGVGTFSIFGRIIGRKIGVLLGLAFGYGIRQNIEEGYEYLMNTYEPGDVVYLFGFSRGAYTARALAGMIHQFGILRKYNTNLIPYVSKMYFRKDQDTLMSRLVKMLLRQDIKKYPEIIKGFKALFSQDCVPYFIGVWDTVGALGPNLSKRFHNNTLNTEIKYGFQAISVDEKRRPYKVVLWDESSKAKNQIIEQVWFPGVHSEVGGGCSKDNCSLPDIALAWMMDKASQCDLRLKGGWQNGLSQDAAADIHDSSISFPWFIPGLKRKREIPDGALIHQSVVDRMEKIKKYRPRSPEGYATVSTDSYQK
ncbi:MAG TPA: DUF2235 domain-containing protein [Dehalococcoidia bacterium]|nr:DUF2235 domain-containing protein [Dehalococcoidia bacterium]